MARTFLQFCFRISLGNGFLFRQSRYFFAEKTRNFFWRDDFFSTDWRFAPSRSEELVDALIANQKNVSYIEVDAPQGHDAFLFPIPRYVQTLRAFLGSGLQPKLQGAEHAA